ncbi:glycoside hydrolase family 20 zincin-like fold domain-containing protein [Amycolatopsis thermoflava]|uniref:glycoside hydrolase family 20 zincin-like fold domain-containing protein n=1 Tax=Amycolatopsis thermoflava TaxID=84480 RepID=UPI003EB69C60
MELLPQPRQAQWTGERVPVGKLVLDHVDPSLRRYQNQFERIAACVGGNEHIPVVLMSVRTAAVASEAYEIEIDTSGVRIHASDSLGALHAMRTVLDIWDSGDLRSLPAGTVADWPSFAVRGVFVESFAGVDLMSLADWKQFLDRMGQLKINTVGISIYGCWDIRHEGTPTEYMFTPLSAFPKLRSPQRMVTWNPGNDDEVELTYLPAMFVSDFFGEAVDYAREQGIEVIPHLGGPGHSTLIPRVLPGLSAVDEGGRTTGYGYCISRPEARAELVKLVRALTVEQLLPNGVSRLHVAGDEFYPVRNIDPSDRRRVVSPYCRCPGCRYLTPGEMLIEYLLQVGRVLADEGVTMVHWHDTLVREGVLDQYLEEVDKRRLPQPVIAWWKYNDPVPAPDAGCAETWVCPTTGLFPHLFQQDFSSNIEAAVRRGTIAGASGVLAYGLPDPADHANYACVADLAWNLESSGGANGFKRRWAANIAPQAPEAALQALNSAATVTGSYPLMMYVVHHILPYFSTAAAGTTEYPDDLLRAFAITQPPLADVLRQVADSMRDAVAIMPSGRSVRHWPDPVAQWTAESNRLASTAELFLAVLDAARRTELAPGEVARIKSDARRLLTAVSTMKPDYLAPVSVRELWGFVRKIDTALERLRTGGGLRGEESWHAWIV